MSTIDIAAYRRGKEHDAFDRDHREKRVASWGMENLSEGDDSMSEADRCRGVLAAEALRRNAAAKPLVPRILALPDDDARIIGMIEKGTHDVLDMFTGLEFSKEIKPFLALLNDEERHALDGDDQADRARRRIDQKVQRAIEAILEAKRAMTAVARDEDVYTVRDRADQVARSLDDLARRLQTWGHVPAARQEPRPAVDIPELPL